MSARGWTIIGPPAPPRHAFKVTMRLPWLTVAVCEDCGLFYSSGGASGLFFRRVKPIGFGLHDEARYVDTQDEPADCYRMGDAPALDEAAE